jgi:uncharacterized delta-60 repeat protein
MMVAAFALAALLAMVVAIVAAGGASGAAVGRPGTPDPTFGRGGEVVAEPPADAAESEFKEAAREPDGNLVFVLRRPTPTTEGLTELEMRSPTGAPVPSFGTDGRLAVEGAAGLVTMGDGNILVAVDRCGGQPGSVEMLDASGSPVTSFGTGGCGAAIDFEPGTLSVDGQGRILLSGSVYYCEPCGKDIAGTIETAFARLLPDGSLDPTFGAAGVLHTRKSSAAELAQLNAEWGFTEDSAPGAAAIEAAHLPHLAEAERIVTMPAGDTFVLISESRGPRCRPCTPIPLLARLTPSGQLDGSYGQNGIVRLPTPREGFFASTLWVRSLLVAADGSALLAGRIGDGDAIAIALTPSGAPDGNFADGGLLLEQFTEPARLEATGLTVGARGELIVATQHADTPGLRSGFAVTFGANGKQRPGPQGTGAVETLTRGKIEPDGPGRIVGWGGERGDRVLIASGRDGRRAKSYGHDGAARMPEKFVPQGIAPAPGGGVAVFGSMEYRGIAVFRVGPSGHPLAGFGHQGLAVLAHTESESAAYAGLVEANGDVVLTGYQGGIVAARLLPGGRLDPTFGRRGFVHDRSHGGVGDQIASLDGGVVIANGARGTPAEVGPRLIRLDSRGRIDRGFGRRVGAHGSAENGPLALFTGAGRIVTVTDPHFEPDHRHRSGVELWAYLPDGSIDRSFGDDGHLIYGSGGPEGNSLVPAAAVQQPEGRIVVAATHGIGDRAKLVMLRFR